MNSGVPVRHDRGMSRRPRVDTPGAWHHVMNRCAGRRVVFRNDSERELFLRLVADLEARFGAEVHCFCLLDNHYHPLIRSRNGRVSEAMGWLGSRFTRRVNAERGVDGAVFRGLFTSVLAERDAHLDWLFRYINANPLDLGWRRQLVAYPWSGLATTLGQSSALLGGPPNWPGPDSEKTRPSSKRSSSRPDRRSMPRAFPAKRSAPSRRSLERPGHTSTAMPTFALRAPWS
jgi:REP element-mobilizing transposase RayT